jgi:hypothetical protein
MTHQSGVERSTPGRSRARYRNTARVHRAEGVTRCSAHPTQRRPGAPPARLPGRRAGRGHRGRARAATTSRRTSRRRRRWWRARAAARRPPSPRTARSDCPARAHCRAGNRCVSQHLLPRRVKLAQRARVGKPRPQSCVRLENSALGARPIRPSGKHDRTFAMFRPARNSARRSRLDFGVTSLSPSATSTLAPLSLST